MRSGDSASFQNGNMERLGEKEKAELEDSVGQYSVVNKECLEGNYLAKVGKSSYAEVAAATTIDTTTGSGPTKEPPWA